MSKRSVKAANAEAFERAANVLPRQTEADFMGQILQLAKHHGWRSYHARPARTATGWRTAGQGDCVGWPDILLLRGPRLIVLECKRSRKEKATAPQLEWLAAFMALQADAFVAVVSPEDWSLLERILA